jgi:EAL domain-containing protein (putative c-di-GMP-specific phosphodiesterase class I)
MPYCQPIINNNTGKTEKYECLMRIMDRDNNVLVPAFFLQTAKDAKVYGEMTRMMIEKSFKVFESSPRDFSINLSIEDILDSKVTEFIFNMLDSYPDIAKRAAFEILESEGIGNYDDISAFIKRLKRYGSKIVIDDFGAGYSNFQHLLRLEVDYIKIDSSLIKDIDKDRNSQVIVGTIVDFTKKLGIETVAEFVHSREVYDKVKELGVDYSQGYFLGKPEPSI